MFLCLKLRRIFLYHLRNKPYALPCLSGKIYSRYRVILSDLDMTDLRVYGVSSQVRSSRGTLRTPSPLSPTHIDSTSNLNSPQEPSTSSNQLKPSKRDLYIFLITLCQLPPIYPNIIYPSLRLQTTRHQTPKVKYTTERRKETKKEREEARPL